MIGLRVGFCVFIDLKRSFRPEIKLLPKEFKIHNMPAPLKTFIIYARADSGFKSELRRHLYPFIQRKLLELWDDSDILPGEEWERSIYKNLECSQIVLMLVSSHSLFSPFIQDRELRKALKQKVNGVTQVIPILVSDCLHELSDEIGGLQMLPRHPEKNTLVPVENIAIWGSHNSAWATALRQLRQLIDEINIRIEEKIRAEIQQAEEEKILRFGKYTLNIDSLVLKKRKSPTIKLSTREAELLKLLNNHRGQFISTNNIVEAIWSVDDKTGSTVNLSNYISKLREYFEGDKNIEIDSSRGKGYALIVNESIK